MEEHPDLRATWNVSGCLLERLAEEKKMAFIDHLKFLVKKGRVELTGSAAYHGFLPFLPEAEVIRQIKTNEKILRKYFGKNFKPSGFFLPEMAYTPAVAKIIKHLGYSWLILDEVAYSSSSVAAGIRRLADRPEPRRVYLDAASGLKVIFRNRELSGAYPPDKLLPIFKKIAITAGKVAANPELTKKTEEAKKPEEVFITATDAELYGLRHEDPTAELEKIVKIRELRTLTLSRFLKLLGKKKAEKIILRPSSWESTPSEMENNKPFYLWLDKGNKIQVYLWKLANLSLELGEKFKKDQNFYWHRWHLTRGLASCTFWWASARDFSRVYGPYSWSPDNIERGLEDLVRSIRSFSDPKTKKPKLEAEKYYLKVKKLVWEEHWKKHWRKTI